MVPTVQHFKAILLCAAKLVPVFAGSPRDFSDYSFQTYLKEFGKSYAESELVKREQIFTKNLKTVQSHNQEHAAGVHTWWMEMNEFADWTPEERPYMTIVYLHRFEA